mmetsp:Transcript_24001/g.29839  ORF Transcript_24001/g.29839 Transcript_24001/m.29839 type:complete len:83 (+) Transcript_24001:447-695(+)
MVPEKPNQLNIEETVEDEFRYQAAAEQAAVKAKNEYLVGGPSAQAFKTPANNVESRQISSMNQMDRLGGNTETKPSGKYMDF